MLGVVIIFLMGTCVGFLISDGIKDNWPRPESKKGKSAELRPLIRSAVEAIRRAEQEKANQVKAAQIAAILPLAVTTLSPR